MPKSRTRRPAKMPVGRATLMSTHDPLTRQPIDVFVVSRQSQRSYRWTITDPHWRNHGQRLAHTGTATTQDAAEKAAQARWKAGK